MSLPRAGKSQLIWFFVPSKLPGRHFSPFGQQPKKRTARSIGKHRHPAALGGSRRTPCLPSAGWFCSGRAVCAPRASKHNPTQSRCQDHQPQTQDPWRGCVSHACGCRHKPFCKGMAILRQSGVSIVLTFIAHLLAHAEPRTCRGRQEHPSCRCSGPWRCLNMYHLRKAFLPKHRTLGGRARELVSPSLLWVT